MDSEQLLGGRYRLDEEIGAGGMGRVYRGWDSVLGRPVAVKILRSELLEADSSSAAVERFRREARLVAGFDHPGIVHVYDMGEDSLDGRNVHYLVMQLVAGSTLLAVHRERSLAPKELARIIAEVLSALQHAHERGVVHRDVKPANILITPAGTAKVMDFGIAHLKGAASMLTETGGVVGTAAYLAPEQARDSRKADARSDVYSVGCMLYQLLTDKLPFPGDTPWEMLMAHQDGTFEPLSSIVPDLSTVFDPIVRTALAKDPAARYHSAEAMRADLMAVSVPGAVAPPRPSLLVPQDGPTINSQPVLTGALAVDRSPRRRSLLAGLGAAALVAGAIGVVRIIRSDNDGNAAAAVPDSGGVRWKATAGTEIVLAAPAVSRDLVVIAGYDGAVYSFDANSGRLQWKSPAEDRVRPSAIIADDSVYVASWDRNIYALELDSGSVRWQVPVGTQDRSYPVAPTVADGVVYFGTTDWLMFALDTTSGAILWRALTYGAATAAPAVADGVLYVGTEGSVYGLDAGTGTVRWKTLIGGDVWSAPTVAAGAVYLGNDDGSVYAFDSATGEPRWSTPTGASVYATPAFADGRVYAGSFDTHVHAFDAATGAALWSTPTGGKVYSSPAVADGVVYVGSWDGYLYAFDAADGSVRWKVPTGGQVWSSPTIAGDYVYVGSSEGKVYSIRR